MAELIRLAEDGPLGKAGEEVWVNDEADVAEKPAAKKSTQSKKSTK